MSVSKVMSPYINAKFHVDFLFKYWFVSKHIVYENWLLSQNTSKFYYKNSGIALFFNKISVFEHFLVFWYFTQSKSSVLKQC